MLVYLSVPLVRNRSLARAEAMGEAIRASGGTVSSPWVLFESEGKSLSPLDVFKRDLAAVESSDVIVADVSEPSIGVGMELMAAHKAGVKIVVVAPRGARVSGMVRDLPRKTLVEYGNDSEIRMSLARALQGLQSPTTRTP